MLWCDVGECAFRRATTCQDVVAECLEPQNIVGRTAPSRNVAADCLGPQKVVGWTTQMSPLVGQPSNGMMPEPLMGLF